MIDTVVVFGGTGDLTGRLLLPALAGLRASGDLGPEFRFVGVGQQQWSAAEFADHLRRRLGEHAPSISGADREGLIGGALYRQADVADPATVAAVLESVRDDCGPGPIVVYLALPTQLMLPAARALRSAVLPPGSRVAVEKPFGYDAQSAAQLNDALARIGDAAQRPAIYRVDHATAMTGVQGLARARFPGTDRQIEWNGGRIEQIDLLWEETLALEGRAAFYDRAGALRDVVQNHLLQLLCAIAQPTGPKPADGGGLSEAADRRATVLRAIRPVSAAEVRTQTRRARYTAGRLADCDGVQGRLVPDYVDEDGVDAHRDTETFAEVVLELDAPRWIGTRFVLRAGKALDARRRGALVHFRPSTTTGTAEPPLWLDLDAADAAHPGGAESAAYQRIIAELLHGGTSFAVGAEEAELAWRILMPVLRGWAENATPLTSYPAGSAGPRPARTDTARG